MKLKETIKTVESIGLNKKQLIWLVSIQFFALCAIGIFIFKIYTKSEPTIQTNNGLNYLNGDLYKVKDSQQYMQKDIDRLYEQVQSLQQTKKDK